MNLQFAVLLLTIVQVARVHTQDCTSFILNEEVIRDPRKLDELIRAKLGNVDSVKITVTEKVEEKCHTTSESKPMTTNGEPHPPGDKGRGGRIVCGKTRYWAIVHGAKNVNSTKAGEMCKRRNGNIAIVPKIAYNLLLRLLRDEFQISDNGISLWTGLKFNFNNYETIPPGSFIDSSLPRSDGGQFSIEVKPESAMMNNVDSDDHLHGVICSKTIP